MKEYREATREEAERRGYGEGCDLLIGPGDFECMLGEPEDRTWYRDAKSVIVELNRLHDRTEVLERALQRECAILKDRNKKLHAALERCFDELKSIGLVSADIKYDDADPLIIDTREALKVN